MRSLIFFLSILLLSCSSDISLDLNDRVEVLRDNYGINHIYAKNQRDLFFMQGYLSARDRLFQFEIWRRQATGTVSEIFGEGELKRDIGTRLFMFRGDIKDEFNHYHDDGYEIITSYTDGVNAYIKEVLNEPKKLPVEFELLDIKPQLWGPEVVISRHQGLLGNIGQELDIGRAVSRIGEERVKELLWLHPKDPSLKLDKRISSEDLDNDILELYNAFRKPIDFRGDYIVEKFRNNNQISDLSFDYKSEFNDEFSIGSNNWAISGKKSETGFPILANDPHRSIVAPSLRYLTHLVAPGWDVIGGGEPEIPGISIGHNGFGAWGLTVFRTDAEDLYVYDLDPNDSNRYRHKGEWLNFKTIKEKIVVKGRDDYYAELKYSIHGPVTFIDSKRNRAYAVRCGWLEVGGSPYLASLRMNQAYSWDEFREACNYSNIPGENMVWADKDGNIGWQAVGIAPIRNTHSGLVPVMGDGNYEWDGYLPIVDKPNIYNPDKEFFATANQNVTPESYNKWNAIGFSWSDPYRGDRVNEVLESSSELNMKDMIDLQVDYHSIPSINLIQMISHMKMDAKFNTYFKKLLDWDNKIVKDSEEALIYVNWEREIMRKYHEKYVPDEVKEFIDVQLFRIINNLNELTNKERDSFLMEAFISSVNELESDFGDKLGSSLYGQDNYKHIKVRHPLELVVNDSISKILGFNSYPRGGNAYTPGSTGSNLSQSSGATFRVIIDTENWDNSLASNAPGQSGNPNSKFYRNLYEDWANDKYFKLLYSKDEILKELSKREIFKPN